MPDFTIECHYHCNSAEYFTTEVQGKSKNYKVVYGPTVSGQYEYDYSCDCQSFKFRKHCKHIEEVKASGKHCNWMQFIDGGVPAGKNDKKVCPKCGDGVSVARYAV